MTMETSLLPSSVQKHFKHFGKDISDQVSIIPPLQFVHENIDVYLLLKIF